MSPETRGSHGDFDVVLETSQAYEAEFAALRLREAGIEARVIDQSYRQEPLPGLRSFAVARVLVPTAAAGEARRVLASGPELEEGADLSGGPEDTGSDER